MSNPIKPTKTGNFLENVGATLGMPAVGKAAAGVVNFLAGLFRKKKNKEALTAAERAQMNLAAQTVTASATVLPKVLSPEEKEAVLMAKKAKMRGIPLSDYLDEMFGKAVGKPDESGDDNAVYIPKGGSAPVGGGTPDPTTSTAWDKFLVLFQTNSWYILLFVLMLFGLLFLTRKSVKETEKATTGRTRYTRTRRRRNTTKK